MNILEIYRRGMNAEYWDVVNGKIEVDHCGPTEVRLICNGKTITVKRDKCVEIRISQDNQRITTWADGVIFRAELPPGIRARRVKFPLP